MTRELLELFKARAGIVCCIGAGGKKTTMFRLAAEHPGRIGLTTSAHIEYFPRNMPATCYVYNEAALLEAVGNDHDSRVIAFATPSERAGRHAGITPAQAEVFYHRGRFDLLLIKSDGARSRLIKAPGENEPPLPSAASTVIPVISARVIGRPLSEKIAHRPERLTELTGVQTGQIIGAEHVARLIASPRGALKHTGTAAVVPLINMVDDAGCEERAREAARQALAISDRFDYIVLARMRDEDPIVDVITR